MIGKQLSRWTLAWFASALVFLIASLVLAMAGWAGPGIWSAGRAMAAVHLFALGWLCQAMLGALIQFTPVLSARSLALPGLALPALMLASGGTAMLAGGFLWLDGWGPARVLLLLAPVALAGAFGLAGVMLAGTLIAAGGLRQTEGRMVGLSLAALAGLWMTGAAMVWSLAGTGRAAVVLSDALPLHVILGVGGWLTLAAIGVSYKLFAMFLLAPEGDSLLRRGVLVAALLGLGLALVLASVALAGRELLSPAAVIALPAAATAILYLAEIARLWRARHRPQVEVNMTWSRAALAYLALAAALLAPAALRGGPWAQAAAFAALAGWLSTLTLAQMVKIVSFLTWIQIFAPQIGRRPVPLVPELTDARAAGRWLALWVAGVGVGVATLIADQPAGFRLAALAMLIAVLGLSGELIAIRRLRHLDPARRPDTLPPLVLPLPLQGPDHDHTRTARA